MGIIKLAVKGFGKALKGSPYKTKKLKQQAVEAERTSGFPFTKKNVSMTDIDAFLKKINMTKSQYLKALKKEKKSAKQLKKDKDKKD